MYRRIELQSKCTEKVKLALKCTKKKQNFGILTLCGGTACLLRKSFDLVSIIMLYLVWRKKCRRLSVLWGLLIGYVFILWRKSSGEVFKSLGGEVS